MAKFRCKASGGVVEFVNEYDIEQIRKQDDYEEIVEQQKEEQKPAVKRTKKAD